MDIVSFETAKKLKDAGFPQPEFSTGQFWYNSYMALSFIGKREISDDGTHEYFFCTSVSSGRTERQIPIKYGACFAPSATDILRELGGLFDLSFDCGEFWCRDEKDFNPAEACAAVWLELNPLAPQ